MVLHDGDINSGILQTFGYVGLSALQARGQAPLLGQSSMALTNQDPKSNRLRIPQCASQFWEEDPSGQGDPRLYELDTTCASSHDGHMVWDSQDKFMLLLRKCVIAVAKAIGATTSSSVWCAPLSLQLLRTCRCAHKQYKVQTITSFTNYIALQYGLSYLPLG